MNLSPTNLSIISGISSISKIENNEDNSDDSNQEYKKEDLQFIKFYQRSLLSNELKTPSSKILFELSLYA